MTAFFSCLSPVPREHLGQLTRLQEGQHLGLVFGGQGKDVGGVAHALAEAAGRTFQPLGIGSAPESGSRRGHRGLGTAAGFIGRGRLRNGSGGSEPQPALASTTGRRRLDHRGAVSLSGRGSTVPPCPQVRSTALSVRR